MKKTLLALVLVLTLGACSFEPLTDAEIANATSSKLCLWSQYRQDDYARVMREINHRHVDCDPAALSCSEQGHKKGTKAFTTCVAEYNAAVALAEKRAANPDWAYCTDKGFMTGTTAMAICIQDYHNQIRAEEERRHQRKMDEHRRREREHAAPATPSTNGDININIEQH